MLRRLRHPNIVQFMGMSINGGWRCRWGAGQLVGVLHVLAELRKAMLWASCGRSLAVVGEAGTGVEWQE